MTERDKVWKFLKRLCELREMIESKTAEKERWDAIAEGVTGGAQNVWVEVKPGKYELQAAPKVQASGDPQRMATAKSNSIDLEREIAECQKQFNEHKFKVLEAITKLPFDEFDVLNKIFVKGFSIKDVAYLRQRSYTWVTTKQTRAVDILQEIMVL